MPINDLNNRSCVRCGSEDLWPDDVYRCRDCEEVEI